MDNGKLLGRYFLDGEAEDVGVLEAYAREQDDSGAQDVGRVVAAPEACFDDGHLDLRVGECRQRGGGDRLELSRADPLGGGPDPAESRLEIHGAAVDPDSLVPGA